MARTPQQAQDGGQTGPSRFLIFDKWSKLNTKVARQNLPDDQLAWLENLQPISENVMQAVPGPQPSIATLAANAARFFYANIGNTDYLIAFLTNGACVAVNVSTGVTTTVAAAATFSQTPDMVVFSSARLLIMDPTAGYVTWDGTLLVKSGQVSPNINVTNGGSGLSGTPSVTISGGSGSGATATATVVGGSVVSVNLTAGGSGYLATDQLTVTFSGGGPGGQAVVGAVITNGGSGYTSAPSVTFGGPGTGAAGTAIVSNGVVTGITITAGGSGYTTPPSITFGGPGTGAAATAEIIATASARVWPQITGSTIALFGGRVWWANGRILNFTGTGAVTGGVTWDDISPGDGAGSSTISDYDLAHSITALRSLNNFLYIFGDQSIKQISSITIQNSITLFTILTLASDVGTSYPMTIQSYNRIVLFANKNGIYGIFGATIQKISDDLDGIFQLVDFSTVLPSSALNDFHVNLPNTGGGSIHCYLLLARYNDPVQGARNILLCYQSPKWFVVSQGSLIAIAAVPRLLSTQWETFGSSGTDVTQLLQNGSVGVNIKLQTALSAHGHMLMAKQPLIGGVAVTTLTAQNVMFSVDSENGSNAYTLSASSVVTWINNVSAVVQWQNNSLQNVNFLAGGFRFPYTSIEGYGKFLGGTVTASGVTNLAINAAAIEYQDADLWGQVP